ncbi:uncharacterized protein [Amphiura filiformis]|uniref:uncharacterized protein n=1 Tax=Amphiura filiformis TaxID=82378 RepID=UPI003B2227EF
MDKAELRQQWIDAIGAHNITSSEARVCSLHFEGGRKTESSRVPTIFPAVTKSPVKQEAKQRAKQKIPDQYQTGTKWKKCPSLSTPQSNIETLLHASDILSQRENELQAESRSNTPPSSSVSSPMKGGSIEGGHLLPETPRGSSCMVPGCNNTRSNSKGRLRWYRVPKDETQRKLWLNAIGWPNAVPTDTTRICSAHFIEGIYRKKGDKAVPTIFPPKPKDWQERHPLFLQDRVKVEPNQDIMPCAAPLSPSQSMSPIANPSSPKSSSPRGDQQHGVLSFVTHNHFQAHPYGPTMLRPEMFERSPKQQVPGESRGVTCCIARCHNNTKRTPGLRWYRIPADPTIRQQWIDFIFVTRPDFVPKNHHRVCSAHFEGGMKFSKNSVPTIYDKPFNRRFMPPADYQQGLAPPDEGRQQMAQDLDWHQQKQQQLQQVGIEEIQRLEQHLPKMELVGMAGASGDATTSLYTATRIENSNSPIRERSILPLTYREDTEPVYVNQDDVEVSHEISIPFSGQFDNTSKTANEDLSLSNVLTQDGLEQKKRVGGGGQCFVPGCTNTRRHNPGLKWYRIPKDIDLRTLWLDNIGCPYADPKPHNRVCSDHFEGGYKQFNTSLPTVEKWSETSKHVYTAKPVVDSSSSVVGSSLLAVDDNPTAVDASTPRVTPSAAEMQSLADSLTALAAELASRSVNGPIPDGTTPPLSSALDQSASNDSLTLNSDNLPPSLDVTTSRSRSTSRSSSVATYASDEDVDRMLDIDSRLDNADNQTKNGTATETATVDAAGLLEGCSSSTQCASPTNNMNKDLTHQEHCVSDGSLKTVSLEDKLPVKPPIFEESGGQESTNEQAEDGTDKNCLDKGSDVVSCVRNQEKMTPAEKIQYLEGLVQSMCEELRFKEQKLQEKVSDLTSCQQQLQEKEAECERIKRKCLMMSVRLSSFRKLAQSDL